MMSSGLVTLEKVQVLQYGTEMAPTAGSQDNRSTGQNV
jgi:hypothetical protein